uniref:Putative zinc-ribbon domain-containing protein n=1 Tax=Thermogemmatispora argillosa TaxID=2045280 RepID=A0A455T5Y9_9CHLR|nr:hypothetical protein KTA_29200 [Thermogemmatispora argillosa]
MQMPSTCSYCGTPRDPQARFCTHCGAALSSPASSADGPGIRGGALEQQLAPQIQSMPDSAFRWTTVSSGQQSLKQAGLILLALIGGIIAALVLLGLLSWFIPGLRGLFWCFVGLIALTLFLIYLFVRRLIRGAFRRLFW